jgi:nitrous oxidase accessory protein NosD
MRTNHRIQKLAIVVSMFVILALVPRISGAAQDAHHPPAAILEVDATKQHCSSAAYTRIQDAINAAAPGDEIRVCPGTYVEQLKITQWLQIVGDNGAVLMPSTMLANAAGVFAEPIAAAIFVSSAQDVEISCLLIDTANNNIAECSPVLIGILYQNATGRIAHNAIRNTQLAPSLQGCQSGDGIVVESLNGGTANVSIESNSVHAYQKNGITTDEVGTQAQITGNVVSGIGPTANIAQNGIQVGFGAQGSVLGNTVTDNFYSPCTSLTNCSANATGILLFASDHVQVEGNTVSTNQLGIYAGGAHEHLAWNRVANSQIFSGIDLAGDNAEVSDNEIVNSAQSAVLVEANHATILRNELLDAPLGILQLSGTTGLVHYDNRFFADLVKVQDPAGHRSAPVSPAR